MNIYEVRDNLKRTIASKEAFMLMISNDDAPNIIVSFLEINLEELRNILADVEKCCVKSTEDSWSINPERMGQ